MTAERVETASRRPAPWLVLSPLAALVPVLLWSGLRWWELYSTQDYAHPILGRQLIALPLLAAMLLSLNIIVGYASLLPLLLTGYAAPAARNVYQLVLLLFAAGLHVAFFTLLWQGLGGVWSEGLAYAVPSAVVILAWDALWWFTHRPGSRAAN